MGFGLRTLLQGSCSPSSADCSQFELAQAPPLGVGDRTALPNSIAETRDALIAAIHTRRSRSVGGSAALPLAALTRLLVSTVSEPTPESFGIPCQPGLFIACSRVEGVLPGLYGYEREHHALWSVAQVDSIVLGERLMTQHDHAAAAAIVFITVAMKTLINCFGDRGYRIGAFAVGYLTDRLYLAAEALRLSGSASGAFSSPAADALLGLDGVTHTTVLAFVVSPPPRDRV